MAGHTPEEIAALAFLNMAQNQIAVIVQQVAVALEDGRFSWLEAASLLPVVATSGTTMYAMWGNLSKEAVKSLDDVVEKVDLVIPGKEDADLAEAERASLKMMNDLQERLKMFLRAPNAAMALCAMMLMYNDIKTMPPSISKEMGKVFLSIDFVFEPAAASV